MLKPGKISDCQEKHVLLEIDIRFLPMKDSADNLFLLVFFQSLYLVGGKDFVDIE